MKAWKEHVKWEIPNRVEKRLEQVGEAGDVGLKQQARYEICLSSNRGTAHSNGYTNNAEVTPDDVDSINTIQTSPTIIHFANNVNYQALQKKCTVFSSRSLYAHKASSPAG